MGHLFHRTHFTHLKIKQYPISGVLLKPSAMDGSPTSLMFGHLESFYMKSSHMVESHIQVCTPLMYVRFHADLGKFKVHLFYVYIFAALSNQEVYRMITSGYRMPSPPKCPSHIYDIMLMCWKDSADERPYFNELKRLLENSCTRYMELSCSDTSDPAEGIS